jgi:hypothetical protein
MPIILVVDKMGSIKEHNVKDLAIDSLYKKAGFKTAEGFSKHATWNVTLSGNRHFLIEAYGKTSGKANQENKYDFPPPIDTTLFFGSCVLLHKCSTTGKYLDLKGSDWDTIYENLFGGFEDIENENSESEEEDNHDDEDCTKEGYKKDGFVVDDDEEEEEDDEEYDGEDEEEYIAPKKSKQSSSSKAKKVEADIFLELSEEEYL